MAARHKAWPPDRWPRTDRQLLAFIGLCVLALIAIPAALVLWSP